MGADRGMQRLFLKAALSAGATIDLDRDQSNYVVNVLRMKPGGQLLVFNGEDGEWLANLAGSDRRSRSLIIDRLEREQTERPDLRYLFAPLKFGRIDYLVQKAVEMGAGWMTPVLTRHGQVRKLNLRRMEANAIEATEQCGLLSLPRIDEPQDLESLLDQWAPEEPRRQIVYCDESSERLDAIRQLQAIEDLRFAVLVGPEGGFSPQERARLRSLPFVTPISLGPRILRADTAAVAALAVLQAAVGDWTPSDRAER